MRRKPRAKLRSTAEWIKHIEEYVAGVARHTRDFAMINAERLEATIGNAVDNAIGAAERARNTKQDAGLHAALRWCRENRMTVDLRPGMIIIRPGADHMAGDERPQTAVGYLNAPRETHERKLREAVTAIARASE